jgi:phosphate transport system substrate-binding protein
MKNHFKKIVASFTLVFSATFVAACTPPLPPELQAQLADSSINCGSAPISVSGPPSLAPILDLWSFEYQGLCPDAGATVLMPEDETPADLVMSDSIEAPANCVPSLSVPMVVTAVSIVTSLQGLDGIVLDPNTLSKMINGEITSWSDPEVVAINQQFEVIDLPVQLATVISRADAESIDAWLSRLAPDTWAGFPDTFTITETFDETNPPSQIYEDGGIAFLPFSFTVANGLQSAYVLYDSELEAVPAAIDNITSAATQLSYSAIESPLEVVLDPEKTPLPPAGFNEVVPPWQAIGVQYGHICEGGSELDSQAFLRYGLRTSSQGALPDFGYSELPVEVRGAALELVSRGLPSPSPIEPDTAATP